MSKKTIALKNKMDLVNVNDDDKHVIVTLSIASDHQPTDAIILDQLLQSLTSQVRLHNYKHFVKEPKGSKSKKAKKAFGTGTNYV